MSWNTQNILYDFKYFLGYNKYLTNVDCRLFLE